MKNILRAFKTAVSGYGMLTEGDIVVAAISGGADSMVLLHLLDKLKNELSIELIVAHLNHNLRGRESLRDFNSVKRAASRLGLKFEGKTLKKGELKAGKMSLQEAARAKRLKFLEGAAKKYGAGRIALGHTADDQAETVIMRLLKGSSLTGLKGIPPVRGLYIRPLIGITRKDIEAYAGKEGIGYVVDSSNLTAKYLRNDIRLKLIPYLKRNYNPNITETLSRTASVLKEDDDFIGSEAQKFFPKVSLGKGDGAITLERKAMLKLHKAVLARILLKTIGSLIPNPDVYSSHFRSFFDVLEGKDPSASLTLPNGVRIFREYERIIVSRRKAKAKKPFSVVLKVPGVTKVSGGYFKAEILDIAPEPLGRGEETAYFDASLTGRGPLMARAFKPGDRIVPFGMKGHKKVKEVFIDKKIPLGQRASMPLVVSGKDVLWIPGVRRSGLFKVEKDTGKVLRVVWVKADKG